MQDEATAVVPVTPSPDVRKINVTVACVLLCFGFLYYVAVALVINAAVITECTVEGHATARNASSGSRLAATTVAYAGAASYVWTTTAPGPTRALGMRTIEPSCTSSF
ncbi:hypothetical protein HaLaN_08977, partial [Haematococcus lacustris]